jgi:hypothetical protein
MLEYAFCIRRLYERWPEQLVLYVGQAPLRMPARIETPSLSFE